VAGPGIDEFVDLDGAVLADGDDAVVGRRCRSGPVVGGVETDEPASLAESMPAQRTDDAPGESSPSLVGESTLMSPP